MCIRDSGLIGEIDDAVEVTDDSARHLRRHRSRTSASSRVVISTDSIETRSSLPWNIDRKSGNEIWVSNRPTPYATVPRLRKKRASVLAGIRVGMIDREPVSDSTASTMTSHRVPAGAEDVDSKSAVGSRLSRSEYWPIALVR